MKLQYLKCILTRLFFSKIRVEKTQFSYEIYQSGSQCPGALVRGCQLDDAVFKSGLNFRNVNVKCVIEDPILLISSSWRVKIAKLRPLRKRLGSKGQLISNDLVSSFIKPKYQQKEVKSRKYCHFIPLIWQFCFDSLTLLFWFDLFSETRPEILKKNLMVFWSKRWHQKDILN